MSCFTASLPQTSSPLKTCSVGPLTICPAASSCSHLELEIEVKFNMLKPNLSLERTHKERRVDVQSLLGAGGADQVRARIARLFSGDGAVSEVSRFPELGRVGFPGNAMMFICAPAPIAALPGDLMHCRIFLGGDGNGNRIWEPATIRLSSSASMMLNSLALEEMMLRSSLEPARREALGTVPQLPATASLPVTDAP